MTMNKNTVIFIEILNSFFMCWDDIQSSIIFIKNLNQSKSIMKDCFVRCNFLVIE